jgi:hypothetical protein
MDSFLEKIKLGTSNSKLTKWPGTEQDVCIRILSEQDRMDAIFATERLFKNDKIETNLVTAEAFDNEKVIQILYRALRCPESLDQPVAPSISVFRKSISREETKVLISEYINYESECSPTPGNLSDEEFDKLLRDLKKNSEQTLTSITSLSIAKKLLLTLVSQPVTLPQVNG